MKKLALLFTLLSCFSFVVTTGCGGGSDVVEISEDTPTEDAAMEGMTDEEYNKEMEKSMQ